MYENNGFNTNFLCLQGLRVLVVDNNVDCCDLIELLLQSYDVEARKAFSAQQALDILTAWQPDILVSDIALPKVGGFALARQAKTLSAKRGKELLIVIAVTAYINEKMRQLAFSSGFDFWFTKPLELNKFLTVLVYSAIKQSSSTFFHKASTSNVLARTI